MSWSLSEELHLKEEIDDDDELSDCEAQLFDNESDSDLSDEELQKYSLNALNNYELSTSCFGNSVANDVYLGKDKKTVWSKNFLHSDNLSTVKTEVTCFPDITNCDKLTPLDCWELLFYKELLENVVKFTNMQLERMKINYARDRDCALTNATEIRALIGLLYMAGVQKSSHLNVRELWAKDETAPVYFRLVMSCKRFYTLLRALRFDDISTRHERKNFDKLAPIRDIFESFNHKCSSLYSPSEYCCIDQIFETFNGKCSFRQYTPPKLEKQQQCGIRIFVLADVETYYISKMEVYIKDQPNGPFKFNNKASEIVKRLIEPISNSGRNVTIDNWFASIPLANELLSNYNITCVASLRKKEPEIPLEFLNIKKRSVNSSMIAYKNNMVLLSHIPKKQKNMILISTMHTTLNYNMENESRTNEIVSFYNRTKGAVEMVHKLKSEFSVARYTCRWPLAIFFTMLNIAGINSQIIYKNNTCHIVTRRIFLKELAQALTKPYIEARAMNNTLPNDLRLSVRKYLNNDNREQCNEHTNEEPQNGSKIIKCDYCPRRKNRKTTSFCFDCSKPICGEHTVKFCFHCCDQRKEDNDY